MALYNNAFPMGYHSYNPQDYQNYQQQLQQLQQNYQQQLQNQIQQTAQPQPQNGGTFYFVNNIQEVENWVVNAVYNLCREIKEFINTLYSNTDMPAERNAIADMIKQFNF